MINRTLLVGRLREDPRTLTPGAESAAGQVSPGAAFALEVRHPMGREGPPEACTVEVRAVGQRLGEVIVRYLKAGDPFLVEGPLRRGPDGLYVQIDHFRFLDRDVETQYLWQEAWRQETRVA